MNRTRYIFFSVILFLIGVGTLSCKKEVANPDSSNPNVLPPLTHEGKNTFGCKVNGEVWVAYAPFTVGGTSSIEGEYNFETGNFHLQGTLKGDNIFEEIHIWGVGIFETGVYVLEIMNPSVYGFSDYKQNYNCSNYYYRNEMIHKLIVTNLDTGQRIISGTFEMDLVNPSCSGDTIQIREGRFDCRY